MTEVETKVEEKEEEKIWIEYNEFKKFLSHIGTSLIAITTNIEKCLQQMDADIKSKENTKDD